MDACAAFGHCHVDYGISDLEDLPHPVGGLLARTVTIAESL